jgi:1,4-dihydroxy-2-naphthoate octaprenyltransferase
MKGLKNAIIWARPISFWASLCPVLIGSFWVMNSESGANIKIGENVLIGVLCLFVGIFLQSGCNLVNDLADVKSGVDYGREIDQRGYKKAIIGSFILAIITGLFLVLIAQIIWFSKMVLLAIGAICLLAAYFYSGGKKPYGYRGFGELSSFFFFGIVGTLGTVYLQNTKLGFQVILQAIAIGIVVSAMMTINNIHDTKTDEQAGKVTISTRFGSKPITAYLFTSLYIAVLLVIISIFHWSFLILLPISILLLMVTFVYIGFKKGKMPGMGADALLALVMTLVIIIADLV